MFGLEVTALALGSREDNGKEGRRKEGLWMCVYTHRWSAYILEGGCTALSVGKCVRCVCVCVNCVCVMAPICAPVPVYLQMLARMNVNSKSHEKKGRERGGE